MSYYNSGYGGGNNQNQQGQQQQGSSNDGFYSNTSSAVAPPQAAFAGNTQQWTAPHPQQQQQQQQQPQQPAFWNPAAAATMIGSVAAATGSGNDAMIDLASSAGKTFLQSGSARMIPGLEMFMTKLRTYFAVDNYYVKRKMLKIVLPYTSKHWKREPSQFDASSTAPGDFSTTDYALPNADENAPDLYLPSMCLITYVLLCALCYGNAGQFSPEVIPDVTWKCCLAQILEVLAIRFGFYMMQAPVSFLDLFSYTGYKYLGLCVNMLIGLLLGILHLGHRGYYITFLWTASAASYFMLKTMANNIPTVTAATGPKREVMVVAFAASQFATMWFVSQTKFLFVTEERGRANEWDGSSLEEGM